MKVLAFHLMPYADLDLSYTEKYDSAWVTLPNTYYDPEKGTRSTTATSTSSSTPTRSGFDGIVRERAPPERATG